MPVGDFGYLGPPIPGEDVIPELPPAIQATRGQGIMIKLRLRSTDATYTPVVRQFTVKSYRIPDIKFGFTLLTKASNLSINLRGDEEKVLGSFDTVQAAIARLDSWARTLTPLVIKSGVSTVNGRIVVLEPLPAQLLRTVPDEGFEEQAIQLSLNEI